MRHLVVLSVLLGHLAAGAALLDALTARSAAPAAVWVLLADPRREWPVVLRGSDARLVGVHAGGRLLQLHADAASGLSLPGAAGLPVLRLPAAPFVFPGCG